MVSPVREAFFDRDSDGRAVRSYLPQLGSANPTLGLSPVVMTSYDERDRVISQVAPDGTPQGRETSMAYAPRETTTVDPLGTMTVIRTDWRGQVVQADRSAGPTTFTTLWRRDGLGRLVEFVNADGDVQRFQFDIGGHAVKWTLPRTASAPTSSGLITQCFDRDDRIQYSSDPENRVISYQYDQAGRAVKVQVDNDLTATPDTYTMSYDHPTASRNALGRPSRSTDLIGAIDTSYDRRGFVSSTTRTFAAAQAGLNSLTSAATWGLQGELKTSTVTGLAGASSRSLGSLVFNRSPRGLITSIVDAGSELVGNVTVDAFDRPTQFSIGVPTTTATNRLSAVFTRDPQTQELRQLRYGSNNALASSALTTVDIAGYRKDGSPTGETRTGRVDTTGTSVKVVKGYQYDNFGRLTDHTVVRNDISIQSEVYSYSANGRIIGVTPAGGSKIEYLYQRSDLAGAVTQLKQGATVQRTLDYDLGGSVASDVVGSSTKAAAFAANGCLTSLANTSGAQLTQVCDLGGNAILRASKATALSTERRILQLGLSELRHDENLLLHRLPVSGTVAVELAYRTNATSANRDANNSRILMTDPRGSVVAVAPLLGSGAPATTAARDFDAWGKEITTTTTSKPRHGFVGFEPDTAFGTYAFGRRVYDPALRRWLSADPLVSAAPSVDGSLGQLDVWGYAAANPTKLVDKRGSYGEHWEVDSSAACAACGVGDRKSTRLNSSHLDLSRMPSSA